MIKHEAVKEGSVFSRGEKMIYLLMFLQVKVI